MELINQISKIYNELSKKKNLKNLIFFLVLNIGFMFVEVIYGLVSNSLGLLTDGAHMLLDSTAVIIGLYSSYLSNFQGDTQYNFGYYRSEIIGTFINSVFLFFIAIYIVFESIERFISPKEIHPNNLIIISFIGLVINLIGIYFLHDQHEDSHDGHHHHHHQKHEHNHCEHKNQRNEECNTHKQEHEQEGHKKDNSEYNENLYAIYIHILADTLGSVAVLISSSLIKYYGLAISDPICSMFISIMIFYSTLPVLKNASMTLLHYPNEKINQKKIKIEKGIKNIQLSNGKVSIGHFDLWQMKNDCYVGEIKITINHQEQKEEIILQTETTDSQILNSINPKEELFEIENKIETIFKDNKIDEHFIEILL